MNWWIKRQPESPVKILTDWQKFRDGVKVGLQCFVGLWAAALFIFSMLALIGAIFGKGGQR